MDEKQKQLKKWIDESDNIVFFGGAGVSTESGIPDFRSENGIFHAINEYGVRPEVILSHTFLNRIRRFSSNIIRKHCFTRMQSLTTAIRH